VLPNPNDAPTFGGKSVVDLPIPFDVRCQLGAPVPDIRSRGVPVLGASVPEAAVDEDGESCSPEHDIGPHSTRFRHDHGILPESQPQSV
jgi:hypothetical protein